jgi:hypothetical protein
MSALVLVQHFPSFTPFPCTKAQDIQEHNKGINYLDALLACGVAPDAKLSWLLLKKMFHMFNVSVYSKSFYKL